MLPDNRLDFISNIDACYIRRMTTIREKYIQLDNEIKDLFCQSRPIASHNHNENAAAIRTAALARTNLETSLQYAIKTLCLLGEVKDE